MTTDEQRIAAVLHDVVEDCAGWTFERLRGRTSLRPCSKR
jgi:hypothetical protein